MNISRYISAIAFLLLFASQACKKDNTTDTQTYPDYAMLTPGNYWIYERFSVDSNGNGSGTGLYDSCYVEKDTIINGNTYAKVHRALDSGSTNGPLLLRDSLHYIVTFNGAIIFSSEDFTTTFSYLVLTSPTDTISEISSAMANKDMPFTTPAGTFVTSDFRTTYHMHHPYTDHGTNRYLHTRYAKNVGIVSETLPFYYFPTNYTERRLIRYHVQ